MLNVSTARPSVCAYLQKCTKEGKILVFFGGGLQGMCKRMFWKWASLSIGGPTGGPGGEVHLPATLRDSRTVLDKWRVWLWELCEGNLEGGLLYWELWKLGLVSTHRQTWKLILDLSPTVKTRLLSFIRTQSRTVLDLIIEPNTLRGYFYLMGLNNIPFYRSCGAERRKKPQSMLGVSAKLCFTQAYISGVRFLDPEDIKIV